MEALKQYVVSITAAAIICSILSCLLAKSRTKDLIRFVFGVFITVTVMAPFSQLDFGEVDNLNMPFSSAVQDIIVDAERMAGTAAGEHIKEAAEAYILDKAAELNADIHVEIILSEETPPVPAAVTLYGELSPYSRQQLQNILQSDLGIAKENQQWIGDH